MIIDCEEDPDELIREIGDRWFTICNEKVDKIYRHNQHPKIIRIMDCEDGVWIDVSTEDGDKSTRESAYALCKLLNQKYSKIK